MGAGVLLVAIGGGTIAVFLPGAGPSAEPSPLSLTGELVATDSGDATPMAISSPPSAYRAVYRVDTIGDGATTTEEFTVERPFNSTIAAFDGQPPGGELLWSATSNLGRYATSTSADGVAAQTAEVAPSTALGDFRLDATLPDLVSSGTFVPREQRRVLGRTCQVYRTGLPMESLQVAAPSEQTYSDVCVDAAGLLLEEMNVSGGSIASRMLAITVDDELDASADRFTIDGEPLPVDQGGSQLVSLTTDASPAAGYWAWASPPPGYTHVGRYLLRDPAPTASDADADTGGATSTTVPPVVVESFVDVYVAGRNALLVRQGPSAAEPSLPSNVATTAAGALGTVRVSSGLTTSTLLATPSSPTAWFVAVQATSSLADTVALASTLQQQ